MDFDTYVPFILLFILLCIAHFLPSAHSSPVKEKGRGSEIIINGNDIYGNNMAGVRILGKRVSLLNVAIYGNGRAGIFIKKGADDILIEGCDIAYNKKSGININNIVKFN